MRQLTLKQLQLLKFIRIGGRVRYVPSDQPFYMRMDTGRVVTATARSLLDRGLVESAGMQVVGSGFELRVTEPPPFYKVSRATGGFVEHAVVCNEEGLLTDETAMCGQTAVRLGRVIWYKGLINSVTCRHCKALIDTIGGKEWQAS